MIQPAPTARITVSSPVGDLTISEQDGAIVALEWASGGPSTSTPLLNDAADWLSGYFAGKTTSLKDLPMTPAGTDFQRRVWQAMADIPPGETLTYGDVAQALGSAPRAVGGACGANPIPILIPCHRIVGSNGGLGGYSGSGGLTTKRALLDLETSTGAALSRAA
ncbi:MAG: methylated-DNA--[protein]-cysteine S-methyltransferase [Alphaproteobacteria bacterium]|jgi:methylated-DNA-[protein]-cysteine S-methyltransferase|nr:methylated-DNA--[protein]-cysteine S-methyltransferase [Alphaproteobacteria bacterium]MBT5859681.1 methylated-DNA--[protein]-cysteine S-methyltransferase [Alphaproteobacteria bacterium]